MAISEPVVVPQSGAADRLARTWAQPRGFWGWFQNVHHTAIGVRFMVTSFIFFLLGVVLAAMMRWQLVRPEHNTIGPDLYNQLFTMHGSTMMFLFAVPMMEAFAEFLVPVMVGTRELPFPRMTAFL